MKNISLVVFFLFILVSVTKTFSQCSGTAPTFTVDLSTKADTAWTISSTRSGSTCSSTTCIMFIVTLNPQTTLLNFDVTNPAPSGAAYYQINCGASIAVGTPSCVQGLGTFCLTYCKAGGDAPTYHITASSSRGGPDTTIREACTGKIFAQGFATPSITWTSVAPGGPGAYDSYLNCISGCDTVLVTPTAGAPSFIDYKICGNPPGGCMALCDTVRVMVVPPMTVNVTPTNGFICTGGSPPVNLSASPTGGVPPFNYVWQPGSQTTQSIMAGAAGNHTVTVTDNIPGCPPVTQTVAVASVSTPAQPVAGTSGPVCEGSSLQLLANTIAGASYLWNGPNGFISALQSPMITNFMITDTGFYHVAVTVNGCTSLPDSALAMAHLMPISNAGPDQTVCANNAATSLNGSLTNSGGNTWTTNGSGTFNNVNVLNPVYTPGAGDISSGSVLLTMMTNSNGSCGPDTDTILITFNPAPVVSAGADLTICSTDSPALLGSVVNAAGGMWSTSGSGSFSPNNTTINAVYLPSGPDIASGMVNLTITSTGNGNCLAESDMLNLFISSNKLITGTISYSGGNVIAGDVYLIKQGAFSAQYDTVDVVSPNGSGVYTFLPPNAAPGNYYVRAEADSATYPLLINTYFGDDYLWDSASVIVHGCASPDTANLMMVEIPAGLTGPCSISGYVYEGNGFGQKIIPGFGPGIKTNVIPGVPVKVGKNPGGAIVGSGTTDTSGYFSFTNLPYDSYTIYTDIPGYPMDSSYTVNLTPGNEEATDLTYVVDSNSVYIDITASAPGATTNEVTNLSVFPNPSSGNIYIKLPKENGEEVIRILDLSGRIIYTSATKGNAIFILDLRQLNLSTGIYLLDLQHTGKRFKLNYNRQN
jgi:hypothetical protein